MDDKKSEQQRSLTNKILENFERALLARPEFDEASVKALLEVARQEKKPKAADIEAALAKKRASL
ncbi:MAG: hypothetical protein AAFY15_09415 [Cyanobacteria bacterium J06648_11]